MGMERKNINCKCVLTDRNKKGGILNKDIDRCSRYEIQYIYVYQLLYSGTKLLHMLDTPHLTVRVSTDNDVLYTIDDTPKF